MRPKYPSLDLESNNTGPNFHWDLLLLGPYIIKCTFENSLIETWPSDCFIMAFKDIGKEVGNQGRLHNSPYSKGSLTVGYKATYSTKIFLSKF